MAMAIVEGALRPGKTKPTGLPRDSKRLPQPISQLEPTSFINRMLHNMPDPSDGDGSSSSSSSSSSSETSGSSGSPSPSPESSSSGSDSSDDSDPSSDESSSSSGSSSRRSRRHRHKHRHGSKKRRSSRKHKHGKRRSSATVPVLKPVEPEKYFGNPDLAEFHRFISQAQDYLDGYRVKPRKHGSVIARFLDGRAHEFYVNTVSRNSKEWPFKKILVGLFNYCFPINFRQKMREKLRNIRQNGQSVQTYTYELENLFLVLGMDRNEERVDAFWFGLDKYIQGELWKQMLTLQSPYDDVKARAQMDVAHTLITMTVRDRVTTLPDPVTRPPDRELVRMTDSTVMEGGVADGMLSAPPGVASFNMEIAPDVTEALRNLAESTASTGEVHLNSVEFDYSLLPSLRPAWELIAQDLVPLALGSAAPVSLGEPSADDVDDVWADMPSLQAVSDTLSEYTTAEEGDPPPSQLHGGPSSSSSSDGGGCVVPVEDDSVRVSEVDWDELEFPRT
ncbi:hypothetical protein GSI_12080 [Ganoderma sinense ZZ0214-1]|uniref:Retrotransposon gag domain-containing protein n=1 Tax=Ganoderma sinense ZZ0214-1 TaxID=1077348 RepID=A0A2G8RXV4_9APHY|nr:hypothetical protein GSI_12080 [Ganoderma sinense ZZ0214-1]